VSDHPAAAEAIFRRRRATAAGLALLIAIVGWLGYRDAAVRADEGLRAEMVAAASRGAVNLTTIDHERAEQDVQRILDSSTGAFRDDFAQRSEAFIEAARKAQSKSVGTVVEAGLESVDGDVGRVLVALNVMTSNRGVPEQAPRGWRMRVGVVDDGAGIKVSSVEFVP